MRGDLYTRAENLQKGTAAGENSLTAAFSLPCEAVFLRELALCWRFSSRLRAVCTRARRRPGSGYRVRRFDVPGV